MRAFVLDRYGPPEVLRVDDVERPVPQADEVLVCVRASTVTRGDVMRMRSREYAFTRVFSGIRRPRRTSVGSEFAGVVEEVGPAVAELRAGDEVFGVADGANAEYVAVREGGVIAPKPTRLTWEAGAYRPAIDRTYPLDEIVEAARFVETGQKSGNVVLRVGAD